MEKISLSEAQTYLQELDPNMPDKFTVTGVVFSKIENTYYVRWFDEADMDEYNDGASQMKAAGAKFVYSFEPSYRYSAMWFNETESGKQEPVVYELTAAEIKQVMKSGHALTVVA